MLRVSGWWWVGCKHACNVSGWRWDMLGVSGWWWVGCNVSGWWWDMLGVSGWWWLGCKLACNVSGWWWDRLGVFLDGGGICLDKQAQYINKVNILRALRSQANQHHRR